MHRKRTAGLIVLAAISTNAAFTALGSTFDYPDVLGQPVDEVLTAFRASQSSVVAWFSVMALSAALFAPIAVGVGRLSTRRSMALAVPVGVAAAAVQVVGLLRWPLLVPGYAADASSPDPAVAAAARESFTTAHHLLGTVVGETLGYTLTAAWTLLVLMAVGRRLAGPWFTAVGATSAGMVLAGVLSPLDLPGVDTANFAGYVLWSAWLLALAVLVVREPVPARPATSAAPLTEAWS